MFSRPWKQGRRLRETMLRAWRSRHSGARLAHLDSAAQFTFTLALAVARLQTAPLAPSPKNVAILAGLRTSSWCAYRALFLARAGAAWRWPPTGQSQSPFAGARHSQEPPDHHRARQNS